MCLDVRHMRYLRFSIIAVTATLGALGVSSAAQMYENLNYGDSKDVVQKKLDKVLGTAKGNKTIFGRTGMNGMYTARQKVQGLEFSLYFGWNNSGNKLTLNAVDLYSSEASRDHLQRVYKELTVLFTEIYGKPKFNNGLPGASTLKNVDMTQAGAVWFYGSDALALCLGRTQKGYNLVIQFMDEQPKLVRTP